MGHIPEALALALRDAHKIKYAIETGTYKGESTRFLAENFRHVWTIEMDNHWWQRACEIFTDEYPNLMLVNGDSREKLREILSKLDGPALLWLDAHWCGVDPKPEEECPLQEELYALRAHDDGHYVLIDDARFFTGRPKYPHNPELWPTFDAVRALLPARYCTMIKDDMIVSVPGIAEKTVQGWANG